MRLPAILLAVLLSLLLVHAGTAAETKIDPPATEVHLNAVSYQVAESDPAGVVYITLVANGTSGLVHLTTTNGTAQGRMSGPAAGMMPGDYQIFDQDVSLTATSTVVPIVITDDTDGEGAETFTVTLSLATLSSVGLTIGSPSVATVTILDNDPPTVTSWSPGGTTLNTATAEVTVTFSEAVTIITNDPTLINATNATIASVTALDATHLRLGLGGLVDGTIVGITLYDGLATDGDIPTHTNAQVTHNYTIDRSAPTVTVVSTITPTTTASPVVFTLTFSEAVAMNGTGAPLMSTDLQATNGTIQPAMLTLSGSTPSAMVNVYPIQTGTVTLTVPAGWVKDTAGNPVAETTGSVAYIDNTAPYVVSASSTNDNGTYGHGSDIELHVTFSEPVTLTGGNLVLTLNNSESAIITPFAGQTMASTTYHVGPGLTVPTADLDIMAWNLIGSGVVTLHDASGNNATFPSGPFSQSLANQKDIVIIDKTPATYSVTTTTPAGTYGPFDGLGPINLTITFSRAVTIHGHEVQFLVNARSGPASVVISAPPFPSAPITTASWSTSFTSVAGDAANPLAVTGFSYDPSSSLVDSEGLTLTPTAPTSNLAPTTSIIIDGVAPEVTTLAAVGSTTTSPIHLTVTLSEPSADFSVTDITVTGVGGTLSNFAGSGTSYTADIAPTAAGTVTLQIAGGEFHDAHNNPNVAKSVSLTYDPAGGSSSTPAASSGSSSGCGMGSGIGALALLGLASLMLRLMRRR